MMTTWRSLLLIGLALSSNVMAYSPAPLAQNKALVVTRISEHAYVAHGPQEFPNPGPPGS